MNPTLSTLSLLLAVSVSAAASPDVQHAAQPLEKIASYPQAKPGMTRQVITLAPEKNEQDLRVELLVGKVLDVDCNRHMIGGTLTSETLAGWGYDYLVVEKLSEPASTMMACPEPKMQPKFVAASLGPDAFQPYNSRLPIVVYVPQDAQVKYRIWRASETVSDAVKK